MQIYIRKDYQVYGPYSQGEVESYLKTGLLHYTDDARADESSDYQPLATLLGLSTPPPPAGARAPISDLSKKSSAGFANLSKILRLSPAFQATAFALLLVGLLAFGTWQFGWQIPGFKRPPTVEEFLQEHRKAFADDLLTNKKWANFVEGLHLTVTCKAATLRSLKATTIDGSDNAGFDGDNISEIDMIVTFQWDGVITKDGYTDVEIVLDYQNGRILRQDVLDSNALINTMNIDWKSLGATLLMLFSAM